MVITGKRKQYTGSINGRIAMILPAFVWNKDIKCNIVLKLS